MKIAARDFAIPVVAMANADGGYLAVGTGKVNRNAPSVGMKMPSEGFLRFGRFIRISK